MNSIKKNNSGFTLIELLITIVIIGIISIPFLNSFIQAINMNVEARRLQNATTAAQDLAEEFKADSLSDLLDKYAYTITTEAGKLDVYKFKTMEVKGADGEKFFVDVELDPNIVYDSTGACINGNTLPMFSNLFGGDTTIIFKQYVESDTSVDKSTMDKTCNVDIVCTQNESAGVSTYSYEITLTINYTYKTGSGTAPAAVTKKIEKTYSEDDKHTIYLLASVFDTYSNTLTDADLNYYASDKINITYQYNGDDTKQKDVTFYLAEQPRTSSKNNLLLSRLNPTNITVKVGTEIKNLTTYISEDSNFKINTNAGKRMEDTEGEKAFATEGSLTYDPNNISQSLYMMNISVRYGSKDADVITTFTTTKEE